MTESESRFRGCKDPIPEPSCFGDKYQLFPNSEQPGKTLKPEVLGLNKLSFRLDYWSRDPVYYF